MPEKNTSDTRDRVTAKQERFCQNLVYGDYTQTQAALRAGYSEKSAAVTACRLLKNANIRSRVRELQQERLESMILDKNWVLLKLKTTVDRGMSAEPVMAFDYDTKEFKETGVYTFDGKTATKALELIGKELKMFGDSLELRGSVRLDDARAALFERLSKNSGPGRTQRSGDGADAG